MSTLYQITGEYLNLLDMADEEDEAFLDTLESIQGEIEEKAESYVVVMKEMDASIAKYDAEIKRLTDRMNTISNHKDEMKRKLFFAMIEMGVEEIKTEHFKLKICNNGGQLPMKVTGDVPNNFQKVILEPDNKKIREALEKGENLGFAHLEERGKHLRIS